MPPFTRLLTNIKRHLVVTAIVLLGILASDGLLLLIKWPFTRKAVTVALETVSSSRVRIRSFHETFLPSPGYDAEDVSFTRGKEGSPTQLALVHKLQCRATWPSVLTLTHRISHMRLQRLRVSVPDHVPSPLHLHAHATIPSTVTELIADGAVLDVMRGGDAGQALEFSFPKLRIGNLAKKEALKLETVLHNPAPPGDVSVRATLGPLQTENPGAMPLSGSFHLVNGDLGHYHVIGGTLSSSGAFRGTIERVQVLGRALIRHFSVTSSHHELGLSAEFVSLVDGVHGDVVVQNVVAHFLHSTVIGHGSISNDLNQHGKTVALDVSGGQARVEDLLRLFVTADRPPLNGQIQFRTHITLPPGEEKFLRRVRLKGDFAIHKGEFTHPGKQEKVDELSARARGRKHKDDSSSDLARVVSDFKGIVTLRNAQAQLSNTTFHVPGALAVGGGTFDLESQNIDLRGKLAMEATLSKAAGGIKSIFLIPLDPFFKRKNAGAVLPFQITGTYSYPSFRASLSK